MRVGATRPQLTFLPTPQLNCALHQKQIRVDESTTNGKTENILLLDVLRIYLLPSVNPVHYDIDFSRKKHSVSALHQDLQKSTELIILLKRLEADMWTVE